MNSKLLLLTSILLFFAVASYGQTRTISASEDSLVIFTFIPNDDMFYAPFENNESELNRLLAAVKRYRHEISNGEMPVYVNGYCTRSMNKNSNLSMARIWSNRVKSELIVRRRLKEENFVTRNHSGAFRNMNNVVVVALRLNDKLRREVTRQTGENDKRENIVSERRTTPATSRTENYTWQPRAVEKDDIYVDNASAGFTQHTPMKVEVTVSAGKGTTRLYPDEIPSTFSVHTNLLYWAIATPNLGFEWRPNFVSKKGLPYNPNRFSLLVHGAWTRVSWKDSSRKYRIWTINPEIRYYLDEFQHWFVGAEGHWGRFDMKFSDNGREGKYAGGGVTGGYRLNLSDRFDMDFTLGLGYTRTTQDKYSYVDDTRVNSKTNYRRNIWGPTQAGIMLRYRLVK